jgi:hypothetical protein
VPAFFTGNEENSNVQMGNHARMMRSLCALPGEPTVIAACHPVKNAENLLPRGGGAFVAEVDGNLTCSLADNVVSLHWEGKFRGSEFDPLPFALETVRARGLVDGRGREIPTVICRPISELEQENRFAAKIRDEDQILRILRDQPGESLATMATRLGWSYASGPHKMRVSRVLVRLRHDKLAKQKRGKWVITNDGLDALKEQV